MAQVFRIFANFDLDQSSVELSDNDAHHLIKVLRLKVGDSFQLVNENKSKVYEARLTSTNPAIAEIKKEILQENNTLPATLIFAVCKGDKNELVVEKCTELGVSKIIFWQSERSISKLKDNKLERIEKIAYSAACQSKRTSLPNIIHCKNLKELESEISINQASTKIICSLSDNSKKLRDLELNKPTMFAIGPEGDFTDKELNFFKEQSFIETSLGETVLRSETAAICAISAFRALVDPLS